MIDLMQKLFLGGREGGHLDHPLIPPASRHERVVTISASASAGDADRESPGGGYHPGQRNRAAPDSRFAVILADCFFGEGSNSHNAA